MATWILFWTYLHSKISRSLNRRGFNSSQAHGGGKGVFVAGNFVGRWQKWQAGMCPLILSAGVVSVLENVHSEPLFGGNLDEREGAAVVEAVTEVSVLSHGRVEDEEVWTSLKRNNWGIEKEILLSHTAVWLLPVPTAPGLWLGEWGLHIGLWNVEKRDLLHLFPCVLSPCASAGSRVSKSCAVLFLEMAQPHQGALKRESSPSGWDWLQPANYCWKIVLKFGVLKVCISNVQPVVHNLL